LIRVMSTGSSAGRHWPLKVRRTGLPPLWITARLPIQLNEFSGNAGDGQ
jgi:hypothetical protein